MYFSVFFSAQLWKFTSRQKIIIIHFLFLDIFECVRSVVENELGTTIDCDKCILPCSPKIITAQLCAAAALIILFHAHNLHHERCFDFTRKKILHLLWIIERNIEKKFQYLEKLLFDLIINNRSYCCKLLYLSILTMLSHSISLASFFNTSKDDIEAFERIKIVWAGRGEEEQEEEEAAKIHLNR